jgi:hypothetical protein
MQPRLFGKRLRGANSRARTRCLKRDKSARLKAWWP